jgi:hypothetical protein
LAMKTVNELVAAGVVNPPCVRHAERHDIVDDLAMASSPPRMANAQLRS